MNPQYDILIIGAGLFGSTCAYELNRHGFRCMVVEMREHIGGNCYTEDRDSINIHKYGPHIFHTSDKAIWKWINQFATINQYRHHVKVNFHDEIYSFPPNLATFHQIWNVHRPDEARLHIERVRGDLRESDNLESWIISQVGSEIYEIFFKGYTQKQWGRLPSELPASIVKRIPIRYTFNDNYFTDYYQGIPMGGYSPIFQRLLTGITVQLNTDYLKNRGYFNSLARAILYTGALDKFYDYRFGRLEYRSLRFEHERHDIPDYQGVAQMNYTSAEVPFTRIIEHKHFEFGKQPVTWITKEYPAAYTDGLIEMYPVRDSDNLRKFESYRALAEKPGDAHYYFGGRLAEYQYYDMHQVIAAALKLVAMIQQDLGRPLK